MTRTETRARDVSPLAQPCTHIVGAGLAGLSAAVRISESGGRVAVYEAAGQAGGRCRSYYDAAFGDTLDNGNHLLLSGNSAALNYAELIGGASKLTGPAKAEFNFADARSGERWTLSVNDGWFPAWLFDKSRRVPGTTLADYLPAVKLLFAGRNRVVNDSLRPGTALYERLWEPVLVSALNTKLNEASAKLAGSVMRESLAKGGAACRPLVADGLSAALVDPALTYLARHPATVSFNARLTRIETAGERVVGLTFGASTIDIAAGDTVILAVPPWIAAGFLPEIKVPTEHRSILNAHFAVAAPPHFPKILGVVNGLTEWIFAFPGRLSITVSAAERVIDRPREELAAEIWREVAGLTGLSSDLPRWQIVKEKRATFAATPEQDRRRPDARTAYSNLFLAGDWVQTGLPATIEGSIRSGETAARLCRRVSGAA